MKGLLRAGGLFSAMSMVMWGCMSSPAISGEPASPVQGFDIHVQAPHMMADGTPGGPFHHYCKGISDKIL